MIRRIFVILLLLVSIPAQAQNADSVKTGRFEIETTSADIMGLETAQSYNEVLKPDEKLKWTVYVPDSYNPASPPGIMIQMAPIKLAKIPFGWTSSMDDKNMIWISLNKTSDRMIQQKEMLVNILSTALLENNYRINSDRIYIVASADSCYPASAAAQIYPMVIKGVVYSTCDTVNWKDRLPAAIDTMRQNRYVFVASNEAEIKRVMRIAERRYNDAGIENTEYMSIQKLFYGKNIDRRRMNQVIDILDVR